MQDICFFLYSGWNVKLLFLHTARALGSQFVCTFKCDPKRIGLDHYSCKLLYNHVKLKKCRQLVVRQRTKTGNGKVIAQNGHIVIFRRRLLLEWPGQFYRSRRCRKSHVCCWNVDDIRQRSALNCKDVINCHIQTGW